MGPSRHAMNRVREYDIDSPVVFRVSFPMKKN